MVPGVDEIVVGQDGRVGVANQEDSSAAEILKEAIKRPNSHSLPPSSRALPPAHSAVTHLRDVPPFGVVRLLDDGGALAPVPDLAPEAERLDLQVLVPRPREHAASALQEVPHLQRGTNGCGRSSCHIARRLPRPNGARTRDTRRHV